MKKLTLQWRLTFMTVVVVAVVCLLLNLILNYSAGTQIEELGDYIVKISLSEEEGLAPDVSETALHLDLPAQIQESKDVLQMQSLAATLAVIILGGIFTYFLAGRVLRPLKKLSDHVETLQAQNLSEVLQVPDTQDEVARLTRNFNGMQERLEQAFAVQRQFSANAAHELRTPLAVMQTNLDVFGKREQPTAAAYEEMIHMMQEQTGRLSHLVSVLLEMTELQTVQRTDHIFVHELVEEVLCDLAQVAEEKQITLTQTGEEAEATGSDLLLYRAVYNLVENGIKYNHPGGNVTVETGQTRDSVSVLVSDTGIGIGREEQKKIFEPFYRVDKSRSRAMGGAGLGLALVSDIAHQHGGTVQVLKSSKQGTQIRLQIGKDIV